jgi:hypothetical protein
VAETADISDIPPEVLLLFCQITFQLLDKGFAHYSADAILHRIRWHYQVDMGMRDFKCNNNWTPHLARWFIEQNPWLDGFFEMRILRAQRPNGGYEYDECWT